MHNAANLISGSADSLGIGSAGLLRNGAQAWVQLELPESITTPEGVTFYPYLVACDSCDGSLARTYKTGGKLVVCDNTLSAALNAKDGAVYKLKHTRNSGLRIGEAREALQIVYAVAEDFAAEVATLCADEVTDDRFRSVLDILIPVSEDKGRSRTVALDKRAQIETLYRSDARCAPWTGTAFGVLQSFNTYAHHYQTVRNMDRAERNMSNAVTGVTDSADAAVIEALTLTHAS